MKFLVIQQKMIGDVLTSTILCENLKERYPDCQIHFVANEHTLAVLENNPFIDKVIVFKNHFSKNKFDFYDFLKEIKKEEYYAVIDVYGKLESNLISHFARAQYKIAHDKWYTRWVYTDTIKEKLVVEGTIPLAMHNRLRLLDPLLKESNTYVTNPKLYLQEAEMEAASQVATALKSEASQPLIMMGILGSDSIKTYPAAYMASIIGTICENTNAKILFNYLPHQEKEARAIYDLCDPETQERIAIDFYAPSLREFIALLSQCEALIGNEGGAVNMAKAIEVPTFCMFSPFILKEAWHNDARTKHVGAHLKDYKPELFENQDKKYLKKNIDTLYDAFEPALFNRSLLDFLKEHCN